MVKSLGKFIDYQCMIILLSCLGSFAAGVAVGMLIVSYRCGKANMQMEEIIEKTKNALDKCK